jgi:hypothetical protein
MKTMFRNLVLAAVAIATLGAAAVGSSTSAKAHDWGYGGQNRSAQYFSEPGYGGPQYFSPPRPRQRPWFAPRPHAHQVHYGFGYGYRYNRSWVQRGW